MRPRLLPALLALGALLLGTPVPAHADEEPPTLARALFLEKTARDPRAALSAYVALRSDPTVPAATRVEARLGEARCLLALRRDAEAIEAWRRLLEDADAGTAAKEEARTRLAEAERARAAAAGDAAEAARREAERRIAEAQLDQEGRVRAATRLVESARGHLEARRYEDAREALLRALERNPDDAAAAALLEEVGGYLADRGDLLRQAIRFVASHRLVDWRRLASDVEGLKEAGRRALKDGKPGDAARLLRDAIQRIDESDFRADLADRRLELVSWFGKALDESRAKGAPLDDVLKVPAAPEAGMAPRAWRGEFFALLGRVFAGRTESGATIRFHDATSPPDPRPDAKGSRFVASGIPATLAPGTLRRARWLERFVRAEVAPGTWAGRERLLERYDDLLVVQHADGVQRKVEEALGAFAPGPPVPVRLDVRLYGAKPGGVFDALETLHAGVAPGENPAAPVVGGARIDEQATLLAASQKLVLLGQATLRLGARHAAAIHFREATAACPLYADRDFPPIVVPDADASYGLVLEVYAEDLPARASEAAVSVVATVRRPDRARLQPRPSGPVRVPTMLVQTVEGDRRVPHGGSLAVLGLANPFRATGAAGDASGGAYPDLLVLVAARPVGRDEEGGVDAAPPRPAAATPGPAPAPEGGRATRETDLGALGGDVRDHAPPEDWPSTPVLAGPRPEAASAQRDAFLAGWLADRAGIGPEDGIVVVRDGRLSATLPPERHAALDAQVAALAKDESRLYALSVRATEMPRERAAAFLDAAGVERPRPPPGGAGTGGAGAARGEGAARVVRVDAEAAARLEERLDPPPSGASPFALDARVAARHTQQVTAHAVRSRTIVADFRVARGADGKARLEPVPGTVEEGIVVGVRPVAWGGGLTWVVASAALARADRDREEAWTPPGGDAAERPTVVIPRHAESRVGGQGAIGPGETLLLVADAPGSEGARVVLVRVRLAR